VRRSATTIVYRFERIKFVLLFGRPRVSWPLSAVSTRIGANQAR